MNKLQVTASEYLNTNIFNNPNDAYIALLDYINDHKNPDDIIIEDKDHFHIQIKLRK